MDGTDPAYSKPIQRRVTFSWFASIYSSLLIFFAHFFGKKSILILGGVDVAKEKDFHYGIWNSWWKSPIIRYGITHASNRSRGRSIFEKRSDTAGALFRREHHNRSDRLRSGILETIRQ